jgi:hypothetical protein
MWKFTLIDQGTGSALDSGTLFAFEDKRAASRIATAVISRIRARRPLPGASSPSVPSLVAAQSGDPQKPREWRIKLLSEEPTEQPENALRLSLEDGRLVAKTGSGVAMFSIPTADLVDVALGKRRDLSLGATMALDAETVQDGGANCGGDGHAEICALGVAVAYPILWTVDLSAWVLGHMKTPHHVIRVAWRENGAIRTAEWKIFKGDWKALFATLDALAVLR